MTSVMKLSDLVDVVIGVDTHVETHSAAAVDVATGAVLAQITVIANAEGYAELVAFAGVRPGMRVVDLIPGSGYFTRIFSHVVGPTGRVYVVWPDEYAREAHPDPENSDALAKEPAYRNIRVLRQPSAPEIAAALRPQALFS